MPVLPFAPLPPSQTVTLSIFKFEIAFTCSRTRLGSCSVISMFCAPGAPAQVSMRSRKPEDFLVRIASAPSASASSRALIPSASARRTNTIRRLPPA